MAAPPVIVWFRQDLRLTDNPALTAAAAAGPVVGLYVLDDDTPGSWHSGGASRWWLHGSLAALAASLAAVGVPLVLRRGPSAETVAAVAQATGAAAVHWNDHPEPHWRNADAIVTRYLATVGIDASVHPANTLFPLGKIVSRLGQPLQVFTPFWRACLAADAPAAPTPRPTGLRGGAAVASDSLDDWRLLPTTPDWAGGLRADWTPGEAAAQTRLAAFLDHDLHGYASNRDRPEPAATSRLSPYLHFGEISPRQIWRAVAARSAAEPTLAADGEVYLREIGWREFYMNVLHRHADVADTPMQEKFARFPYQRDESLLQAWQRGRTGYPIVDAGMRQLWHTGWMHNRVRMIVASFLIKHLVQPWQDGEAWFWDTLVDADLANNSGGWQWVAGCGTDAAPFFRIFNPVTQGERFDSDGAYVRRWVPELSGLQNRLIHRPWEASPLERVAADVSLGRNYPNRLIEHGLARNRALAAFERLATGS